MPICAQALNRQHKEILAKCADRFKRNLQINFAAIGLTDFLGLVAVWELNEKGWHLLSITRPKQAITLCNSAASYKSEFELLRLILPTDVKPDQVWGKHPCVREVAFATCKLPTSRLCCRWKQESSPR